VGPYPNLWPGGTQRSLLLIQGVEGYGFGRQFVKGRLGLSGAGHRLGRPEVGGAAQMTHVKMPACVGSLTHGVLPVWGC